MQSRCALVVDEHLEFAVCDDEEGCPRGPLLDDLRRQGPRRLTQNIRVWDSLGKENRDFSSAVQVTVSFWANFMVTNLG